MSDDETSKKEPEARFEGLGLGLGLAAGGAFCWVLPRVLHVGGGWLAAGQIAAWALFVVGSAGTLTELDKERRGFGDLAVSPLLAGVGIGFLALATRVLNSGWAGASAVLGVLLVVFALAVAGTALGKIASPQARTSRATDPEPKGPDDLGGAGQQRPRNGLSRGETWALVLAAIQVVLGALALL